jgi:hypothetical protein
MRGAGGFTKVLEEVEKTPFGGGKSGESMTIGDTEAMP